VNLAKEMIVKAKEAGADAVKFQTYKTEKRVKQDSPIFAILKKCELSDTDTKELSEFCKQQGMIFFSTPFDAECADFLYKLDVPLMKVASFDIVNKNLLRSLTKGKPVIISRGMSNKKEIDEAIRIFKQKGVSFALLHCISAYPTKDEDANLNVIRTLKANYDCPIGFSDHTLGIKVPVLSVAAGASIVEKHFTLDRNMDGPDHKISCDPKLLKKMVKEIRTVEKILGEGELRAQKAENDILKYRRPSD
jgi:sialic acid synthase SpsE